MSRHALNIVLPTLLITLGGVLRLVDHPANFAPIGAMALFGGMVLGRKYALVVPLFALFVGDVFLGFYSIPIMASVYGSFVVIGLIGLMARSRVRANGRSSLRKSLLIFGSSILGSILFFLMTNWAVWAFGTMYPKSIAGLMQSYVMAFPFFRGTLLGDLFYNAVFFGVYALVMYYVGRMTKERKFDIAHSHSEFVSESRQDGTIFGC